MVLLVEHGAVRALLPADAEAPVLARSRPAGARVCCGCRITAATTRSLPTLLERVHPHVASISVGAGNYLRPSHAQVLDDLAAADVSHVRTDEDGTIVLDSDGRAHVVGTRSWARTIGCPAMAALEPVYLVLGTDIAKVATVLTRLKAHFPEPAIELHPAAKRQLQSIDRRIPDDRAARRAASRYRHGAHDWPADDVSARHRLPEIPSPDVVLLLLADKLAVEQPAAQGISGVAA